MLPRTARWPATLALVASVLGLVFASYSTFDYAAHLDRQLHAVHCSFIPGAPASEDVNNACRTAMYSPYAALLRGQFWGGVPIASFAVGAFAFFVGFALWLVLARERSPLRARLFFGVLGLTPVVASVVMFFISLVRLGSFCKLCVGIYVSSLLLAVAAGRTLMDARSSVGVRPGHVALPFAWLAALGASALLPAALWVATLPDYRPLLASCGKLPVAVEAHGALLKLPTKEPRQAVTLFVDPLCPTCKALHERLLGEGVFERLDPQVSMFPLDSDCNWMLDRPVHPGACVLARAVLCGGASRARQVLEWSYDEQETLAKLGKDGAALLKAKVVSRWGQDMAACLDARSTTLKLNQHLQFAVANHVPVSTPQMFLGDQRVCDEDTDLGLRFTLAQLAPQVLP